MGLFNRRKKDRRNSGIGGLKKTGKKMLIVSGCMLALFMVAPAMNNSTVDSILGVETAYASEATFSEFWFQDSTGSWKVKDNHGNVVKNAWLCDDAVVSNGQNIWYLLDSNGNMVTAGLVQDQTGNFYSLETTHNGFYGMLRYQSGVYDGVNLSLESGHSGGFAKILNQEGINNLSAKYGVTSVNIDNSNCVYTSSFRNSSGSSSQSNTTPPSQSNTTPPSQSNTTPPAQSSGNSFDDAEIIPGEGTAGALTPEVIESIENATYY